MKVFKSCAVTFCALLVLQTKLHAQNIVEDATLADLQLAMSQGVLTSEKLTSIYLARIRAFDKHGPEISSIISLNPQALNTARRLDVERRKSGPRGPLHGIPIILKDNIDTADMPTTAGSYVLRRSIPAHDATIVKELTEAGAIILAKANMDEFAANGGAPNGYSSMGSQTRNPHDPTRSPGGSSGGVAAAVAASFAQLGIGTDTSLSIRGPAAFNGVVGLRPTTGLVSGTGIVPLARSFDVAGPIARSVFDVAAIMDVIADHQAKNDAAPSRGRSGEGYTSHLKLGALKGARIGVVRHFQGADPETDRIFNSAVSKLKAAGAVIIDNIEIPAYVLDAKSDLYMTIRTSEFRAEIDSYLASLGPNEPHTLADLVARAAAPGSGYNNPPKLKSLEQSLSSPPLTDPIYLAAENDGIPMIKSALAGVFKVQKLDAIVYASTPKPAGNVASLPDKLSSSLLDLAAVSGYPELVVPAGLTGNGLPVGISFLGEPMTDARILALGYDFEQAVKERSNPKYTPTLATDRFR